MAEDAPAPWTTYGRALIDAMHEVLAASVAEAHPVLLETADFWLSVGLALGLERPEDA